MPPENHSLAVVEARGLENEKKIDRLFGLTEKSTLLVHELTRAVDSARIANEYAFKFQTQEMEQMKPKVAMLWDNRSEIKGGWSATRTIAVVSGTVLSLVLGLLAILAAMKH